MIFKKTASNPQRQHLSTLRFMLSNLHIDDLEMISREAAKQTNQKNIKARETIYPKGEFSTKN